MKFYIAALMAAVAVGALPEDCFKVTDLVNGRSVEDFPLDSDKSKFDQLTVDHVITELRTCHTDRKIVGMQVTYGVWPSEAENAAAGAEAEDA